MVVKANLSDRFFVPLNVDCVENKLVVTSRFGIEIVELYGEEPEEHTGHARLSLDAELSFADHFYESQIRINAATLAQENV